MKIFFASFPFDEENSGDYDYCTAVVDAINSIAPKSTSATYVTSRDIDDYTLGENLTAVFEALRTSKGSQSFYDILSDFHEESIERGEIASKIIQYITHSEITDQSGLHQNILNLQLRPPETGFLFSPKDLEYIKEKGFKVCITCHEYELNYSRRWLQTVCHDYFKVADLVLFFSEQDKLSATTHAIKASFLDTTFASIPKLSNPSKLLNSFSSTDHSHLLKVKQGTSSEEDNALLVTNNPLSSLHCDTFVGSIKFAKGAPVRFSFSGQTLNLSDSAAFELEYGIRSEICIPKQDKPFTVTGVIINPEQTSELQSIKTKIAGKFNFGHQPYDLSLKSVLTRVPPTTANIEDFDVAKAVNKPPNIVIFGLIRAGKGFEDALSLIQKIHTTHKMDLPETRLIIVGKTFSFELLAKLLNAKFGFKDVITDELLEEVLKPSTNLDQIIEKIIDIAKKCKLSEITKSLKQVGAYSDGIEQIILGRKVFEMHKFDIPMVNPSKLQLLYIALANHLPELLPIDFVLDGSREDLHSVFARAKYAIKYDEKGWANNASGLINLLAYGCVLYTGYGMCTEDEVTVGQYKGAMVLPKGRYCLKPGEILSPEEELKGKRMHFSDNTKQAQDIKQQLVKSDDVIHDMIRREKKILTEEDLNDIFSSSMDNESTLGVANTLLYEQFHPLKVAGDLVHCFENLVEGWV